MKHEFPTNTNGIPLKEYQAWINMKFRCNKVGHPAYKKYGERGISYSEDFKTYNEFMRHVGYAPSKYHFLLRIDKTGNYQPDNVRWGRPYIKKTVRK